MMKSGHLCHYTFHEMFIPGKYYGPSGVKMNKTKMSDNSKHNSNITL